MKKIIAVFLVVFFMVSAAACTGGSTDTDDTQPPDVSGNTEAQKNPDSVKFQQQSLISAREVTLSGEDCKQIYNRKTAQGDMKLVKLGWFYKQTFFETAGAGDLEQMETQYYVFNAKTQRVDYAGAHEKVETGIGESVIMHGRYLFGWAPVQDGAVGKDQLIRVDAQTNQTQVVQERTDVGGAAIHLSKLNENEFIGYVMKQAGGTKAICVEKYNGETGAYQKIIGPDTAGNGGCTLDTACAADGKVYAIGRQQTSDGTQYYVLTYDANGTLLTKTKAPGMEDLLDGAESGHMYVAGNVLAVTSYSGTRYMLYYNDGESYRPALEQTQPVACAGNMANIWDSRQVPYLFFTNYQPSSGIKNDEISLYAVRTADGHVYRLELAVTDKTLPLGSVLMDEAGNLVVVYSNESERVAYQISADTLKKQIG